MVLEYVEGGCRPWYRHRECYSVRAGSVEMHRYETGHKLLEAGVTSGFDSTTESAVTKLMFLFGHGLTPDEVKEHMTAR